MVRVVRPVVDDDGGRKGGANAIEQADVGLRSDLNVNAVVRIVVAVADFFDIDPDDGRRRKEPPPGFQRAAEPDPELQHVDFSVSEWFEHTPVMPESDSCL